jgi:hypothetical protein
VRNCASPSRWRSRIRGGHIAAWHQRSSGQIHGQTPLAGRL